jgi:hypothetical protein
MKRLLAMTLLAAFAAGPSVKWLCEQTCGVAQPLAAADDCHRPDESAHVVIGAHECGDHALPVALVTKRVQAESEAFVSPRSASCSIVATLPAAIVFSDVGFAYSSPPLSDFLVALRI